MLSESRLSYLLQHVSRTFALTIPVLPKLLAQQVGISYLLCRACDSIEDDPDLPNQRKILLMNLFVEVLRKERDTDQFIGLVSDELHFSNPYEKEVFTDLGHIIDTLYSYPETVRSVILKSVWIMSDGMSIYQNITFIDSQKQLDRYCYSVAGIVGELLANLFSIKVRVSDELKQKLIHLSVSFGEGLQLTNIYKDIWDDASRGVCWLPIGIENSDPQSVSRQLLQMNAHEKSLFMRKQVSVALGHLWNAAEFIVTIPRRAYGIRRFCFICVSLAFMTLRNIYGNPVFLTAKDIKITRAEVKSVILRSFVYPLSNSLIRLYFSRLSSELSVTKINSLELYNSVSRWNEPKFNGIEKE